MLITKSIEIDMGHRVPNHKSKCKNLHGHRYKIIVAVDDKVVTTEGASNEGMVTDFGDLKEIMLEEIDKKYDHGFAMYYNDEYRPIFETLRDKGQKIIFLNFIPTAENLAKHWFGKLKTMLDDMHIQIAHVQVWETPNSTATYTMTDYMEDYPEWKKNKN
jgi:6-pyruvoyltetrahydropterin/6-carboxytetrahydropterin synthase